MKKQCLFSLLLSLVSGVALAHTGHGFSEGGLESAFAGLMHPFTGLDHLLVMLAIGVWAAKIGGKAIWQLPLIFMTTMLAGAVLGMSGLAIFGVETAIAISVIGIGLFLTNAIKLHFFARMMVVMVAGLYHGLAHGFELSMQQNYLVLVGILVATMCLHLIGLGVGMHRKKLFNFMEGGLSLLMFVVGGYLLIS